MRSIDSMDALVNALRVIHHVAERWYRAEVVVVSGLLLEKAMSLTLSQCVPAFVSLVTSFLQAVLRDAVQSIKSKDLEGLV